ncbi:hypothetical protein DXU92_03675 [Brachybacterium saurashtrense]|uniref:Uncharacterized protein n=1 Tax=Brachybacterium saurashtrense TaxID=556288 RepID=A0A345YQP4_9MICO|nr:hypothetical protein DWV08_11925 [Brachybacterium saurashtrense]RRR23986.1 hypothetical protein DXU92_03675 [Brachybacterium saurashtrense]
MISGSRPSSHRTASLSGDSSVSITSRTGRVTSAIHSRAGAVAREISSTTGRIRASIHASTGSSSPLNRAPNPSSGIRNFAPFAAAASSAKRTGCAARVASRTADGEPSDGTRCVVRKPWRISTSPAPPNPVVRIVILSESTCSASGRGRRTVQSAPVKCSATRKRRSSSPGAGAPVGPGAPFCPSSPGASRSRASSAFCSAFGACSTPSTTTVKEVSRRRWRTRTR